MRMLNYFMIQNIIIKTAILENDAGIIGATL